MKTQKPNIEKLIIRELAISTICTATHLVMILSLQAKFGNLFWDEYRHLKNSKGENLIQQIHLAKQEAQKSPTIDKNLKLEILKFHHGSTRNMFQSQFYSSLLPVIGPFFVPFYATMVEIPATKRFTIYANWDSKHETGGDQNSPKPISEIDYFDICAYWFGGGFVFLQQFLLRKLTTTKLNSSIDKMTKMADKFSKKNRRS